MGLDSRSDSSVLPLRPLFSWDIKTVPYTDGKGDQTEFANAVRRWQPSHANLPHGYSSKIAPNNQGIVVPSHLYRRARDLCRSIPEDVINSKNGATAIVSAIHKRHPLTVVSTPYGELIKLVSTEKY